MVHSAALSDVGPRRRHNEDRFLRDDSDLLYLVADGMGGAAHGEVAAQLTVESVADVVRRARDPDEMTWPFGYDTGRTFEDNVLGTALALANRRVLKAADDAAVTQMGSTVVAAWLRGSRAHLTHLGDSRLYCLRGDSLRQVTEDHTLVAAQVKHGIITPAQARTHALKNVILRHVGSREDAVTEVSTLALEGGDRLLLCTDGLWGVLDPELLCRILAERRDLEVTLANLIEAAKQAGSDDNITGVLVDYSP